MPTARPRPHVRRHVAGAAGRRSCRSSSRNSSCGSASARCCRSCRSTSRPRRGLHDARLHHRRVAGRPADRRADLRLGRRPDPARAADGRGRRARRHLPVPAARLRRPVAVHRPARPGRLLDRDVRPGGAGLHHRPTPPERRGEAFGLYSAAQMGGLLLGPAIGGLGAAFFGGVAFVFVFGAVSSILAAAVVGLRVPETARPRAWPTRSRRSTPPSSPAGRPWPPPTTAPTPRPARPRPRLINRLLVAAIVINIGGELRGRHVRRHLEPVPRVGSAPASS